MATKRTKFLIESEGGEAAERVLGKLGDSADRASDRIAKGGARGSKGLVAVDTASRAARDSMEDMARRAGPAGEALAALGTKGIAAGAAIAVVSAGLAKSTSLAIDFQTGLINVGKTTDLEGRNLERLGDQIGALSVELGESSDELLRTAQAAGQLGVKGVDNIVLFTETITKLGASSDLAGEQAASTLARLLTITGENVDQVDRLASVIVRLGNNFATTESEIASTATRIAGATAAFDVSSAQAAAFGTAINQIGEQSEAGATQIGKAFRAIASAVDGGGDELREFATLMNISTDDLVTLFREDAVGAVVAFIDALGDIPAEQLSGRLDELGLAGERGNRVFGNLAQNSDVLRDSLRAANEEVEKATALEQEFGRQLKAASRQGGRLGSALEEAGRIIGTGFVEDVSAGAEALADLVEQMNRFGRESELPGQILDVATAIQKFALTGGLGGVAMRLFAGGTDEAAESLETLSPIALQAAEDADTLGASLDSALGGKGPATQLSFLNGLVADLDDTTRNYVETVGDGQTAHEDMASAAEQAINAQIESVNARLAAFESGGLGALERVTQEQERQEAIDKRVADLLEDANVSRAEAVDLATELVDKERELNDRVSDRKTFLEELTEAGEEFEEAAADAQERLDRRQERQAEELQRRQEQQAELMAQPFINAAEGIQDEFSDAIFNIVREGELDFESLGDSILDIFARTFAEVATLRIGMPLIQAGVGGLAGMMGLPAGAQSALSAALPGGGGGLLSQAGGAASIGSALGLGGGGALTANSLTAGTFSGFMAGGPAQFLGMGSQVGIPGGVGSGFVPSGLGIAANSLGAGAIGALVGGPLSGAFGGSEVGGSIGGGLGGAGGAALGQLGMLGAVGGPLGMVAGIALGTLIGGLAGPSANASNFAVRTGSGSFENGASAESPFGSVGLDSRLSDDVEREFSQHIADTIAAMDREVVGLLDEAQTEAVREALQGTGYRLDANQDISEGEMASVFVDRFEKIFAALDEEMPPALAQAARDLGRNNPDVETAVNAGLGALQEIAAERQQREQEEQALESFNERVRLSILEITDPMQARMEAFENEAAARLEQAEALGADTDPIRRLNELLRQRVEQGAGPGGVDNSALERLLFNQTSTSGAPIDGGQVFSNAREAFARRLTAVQAGGGDRRSLAEAAQNVLELGRSRFGSSGEFQDLRAGVLDQIRGIVDGSSVDSGMAEQTAVLQDIGAETAQGNSILSEIRAELRGLREENAELRRDLRELEAERATRTEFDLGTRVRGGFVL